MNYLHTFLTISKEPVYSIYIADSPLMLYTEEKLLQ